MMEVIEGHTSILSWTDWIPHFVERLLGSNKAFVLGSEMLGKGKGEGLRLCFSRSLFALRIVMLRSIPVNLTQDSIGCDYD